MNPFQAQMKNDMDFHKSIREQNAMKMEIEPITGLKLPGNLRDQAGYPLRKKK